MKRRPVPNRGVSLVEVLIASAVLIIGLTGITAMLMRGSVTGRNGQQTMLAAHYANQTMDELTSMGFNGLTPMPGASFDGGGAADGGIFTDGSERRYAVQYIVTDTGAAWPTYRIDVETTWRDGNGQAKRFLQSTTLSRAPDAG